MLPLAHGIETVSWITGRKFLLTVFSIKMCTIHRWFKIDAAERDLGYTPVIAFEEGWADTAAWYKEHWLPGFLSNQSDFSGKAKRG